MDTDRTDADPKTYMQGDANLEGAVYEIWRYDPMTDDYTEYVYDITVDHLDDGYWTATSDELLVGNYMVKEKVKSTEEVDGVIYEYSYAEGYWTDPNEYYFIQDPAAQTERLTTHVDISNDTVVRGRVHVLKFDEDRSNVDVENDSDKVPSAGAILRLTLDSNPNIYYTVKLDESKVEILNPIVEFPAEWEIKFTDYKEYGVYLNSFLGENIGTSLNQGGFMVEVDENDVRTLNIDLSGNRYLKSVEQGVQYLLICNAKGENSGELNITIDPQGNVTVSDLSSIVIVVPSNLSISKYSTLILCFSYWYVKFFFRL